MAVRRRKMVPTMPKPAIIIIQCGGGFRAASGSVAGTLVTVPDWALLCDAMGQPGDASAMLRRTVSCDVLAGRLWDGASLAQKLHQALERVLGQPT